MNSLVCIQPGELEYREIDAPLAGPGQAIIRVRRIGICGTDLHAFEGTQPFFDYPRILGHELAGDLVDFDQALVLNPSDDVARASRGFTLLIKGSNAEGILDIKTALDHNPNNQIVQDKVRQAIQQTLMSKGLMQSSDPATADFKTREGCAMP